MPEIDKISYICLLAINNLASQHPNLVDNKDPRIFLHINRTVDATRLDRFARFSRFIHKNPQDLHRTTSIKSVLNGNHDWQSIDLAFLSPCTQDLNDKGVEKLFHDISQILKPEGLLMVFYNHWWDLIPYIDNPYLRATVTNMEFLINHTLIYPRSLERLIELGKALKPVLLANGDRCSLAVLSQRENPLPVFKGLPFAYGSDFTPNYAAIPFFQVRDLVA